MFLNHYSFTLIEIIGTISIYVVTLQLYDTKYLIYYYLFISIKVIVINLYYCILMYNNLMWDKKIFILAQKVYNSNKHQISY